MREGGRGKDLIDRAEAGESSRFRPSPKKRRKEKEKTMKKKKWKLRRNLSLAQSEGSMKTWKVSDRELTPASTKRR